MKIIGCRTRNQVRMASLCLTGALALTLGAAAQSGKPNACEELAKLAIPQGAITLAQTVAAGESKLGVRPGPAPQNNAPAPPPGLMPFVNADQGPNPAFCRVAATLTPTADSVIKMEVWMPLTGWNGNFHGLSNTGWAGNIMYSGLLDSIQHGFAAVSTDDGHEAPPQGQPNGTFIPGHPEKLIDYGHRSIHLMTVTGKQIVKAYYGKAAGFAVFTGCSLGGMQAVNEAYRYPEDYDGIVAGAPANPMTMFNAAQLWPYWFMSKDPARKTPKEKFTLVHDAAVKACAGPVGLAQNFIDDPEHCNFNVDSLLCKDSDAPDCLTAGQIEEMKAIYQGPRNPRTGEQIFPGPPVGAELQLDYYTGEQPMQNAMNLYRYGVFQDASWDMTKMDYDTAIEAARKNVDPAMKAGNDMTPFLKRGGKLMFYIGWTDYHNPLEVVNFAQTVVKNAGGGKAADQVRVFLIPGMDHCFGGYGCDRFDKLGTIAKWVESGKAPEEIPASKLASGQTVRTSLVCAYPKIAQYKGSGSMEEKENFTCVQPPASKK